MNRIVGAGIILFSLITIANAAAPTQTQPNVGNTLSQCASKVPIVGGAGGAGTNPTCAYPGALPTAQSETVVQLGNSATAITRIELDSFAAASHFSGLRSEGTEASPTALATGSEMTSLNGGGYTGNTGVGVNGWVVAKAAFRTYAAPSGSTWTGTDNGTYADVLVTPPGTITSVEAIKFQAASATSVSSTIGTQQTIAGQLILANVAAGAFQATIQASASATAALSITLPPAPAGSNGLVMAFTTAGVGSFIAVPSASVITAGGPTGSATVAPIITYNAAGQLTAVSSATITPAIGSITGLGTNVATALANGIDTNGGVLTGTTASVAAGAIHVGAGSATATAGVADVATGALLASGGTSANPAYCTACTLTTSLTVPTDYGGSAAGSTKTIASTSNGSPSGDNVTVEGSTLIFETLGGTKKLDYNSTTAGYWTIAGLNLSQTGGLQYQQDAALSYYAPGNGVYLNGNATGWLQLDGDGANRAQNIIVNGGTNSSITFATNGQTRATILGNGNVGLGSETNPQATLTVSLSPTAGVAAVGTGATMIGANSGNAGWNIQTFAGNPQNLFQRADGTAASPAAVVSGDAVAALNFAGYQTSSGPGYVNGARILVKATNNWTSSGTLTDTSTHFEFYSTAAGTTTSGGVKSMSLYAGAIFGSGATDPGAGSIVVGTHILASGTTPTISACGTGSPSVSGSDVAMKITAGTGVLTSCVVNFGTAFGAAPACQASSPTAISALTVSTSTTQVTIGGTSLTSDVIAVNCFSTSFLLNRDLEPASNDNNPAMLRRTA